MVDIIEAGPTAVTVQNADLFSDDYATRYHVDVPAHGVLSQA